MTQKLIKNDFRIFVAQLDPVIGDIDGNFSLAMMAYQEAQKQGADLVLLTKLFVSAYPLEDLVLKPAFTEACEGVIGKLAEATTEGPGIIVGVPLRRDDAVYNGTVLLDGGRIISECLGFDLRNNAAFDKKGAFSPSLGSELIVHRGIKLGIVICEDILNDPSIDSEFGDEKAEILLVFDGSPYFRDKMLKRVDVVRAHAIRSGVPVIYVNQIGGQDEFVFDGGSFALDGQGKIAFQMKHFESHISLNHWQRKSTGWQCISGPSEKLLDGLAADYHACVLALRDYVNKNRFKDVVLGLSGGVDSALCAAMAADALGAERVRTVMMPYHYTSEQSLKDAEDCARLLGCHYEIIPIFQPVEGFLSALALVCSGTQPDVTEENLQSRARGTILMALSNTFGSMVVTTGNKSEMSVGYTTLYGDMCGGFNPIKDLYKTQVYALAEWRNKNHSQNLLGAKGAVIPSNIITKANN